MSRPDRVLSIAPMHWIIGGHLLVVLHGAAGVEEVLRRNDVKARLTRWVLRSRAETWVNNEEVADMLAKAGIPTKVVSPFRGSTPTRLTDRPFDSTFRILVAEGNNNPLYNAEAVLEVSSELKAMGLDVEVTLLNYGPRAQPRTVQPFVRQLMNANEAAVNDSLKWANVLIRPTTTDGDSMLVREALAAGVRVVASDHIPRPAGVELFSLEKGDLLGVIREGGRISDGGGLGSSLDQGVAALFSRISGQRVGS